MISYFDWSVYFVNYNNSTSVDFIHANVIDKKVIASIVGLDTTFVDSDNDDNLDLYLVNTTQPNESSNQPSGVIERLTFYIQSKGQCRFSKVVKQVVFDHDGSRIGCAFAYNNNDGDTDLYLTNYLSSVFFKHRKDKIFK